MPGVQIEIIGTVVLGDSPNLALLPPALHQLESKTGQTFRSVLRVDNLQRSGLWPDRKGWKVLLRFGSVTDLISKDVLLGAIVHVRNRELGLDPTGFARHSGVLFTGFRRLRGLLLNLGPIFEKFEFEVCGTGDAF